MYKKASDRWTKHFDFFILDIIMLEAAYILSCLLRYQFRIPAMWTSLIIRSGVALIILYFLAAAIGRNYKSILQRNKWVELWKVFTQVLITAIALVLYLYLIKENDFSRIIYIITGILSLLFIWAERVVWKYLVRRNLAKNNNLPQLLLIVDQENAESYIHSVKTKQYDYFRVHGAVLYGEDRTGEQIPGYRLSAKVSVDPTPVVCGKEGLHSYLMKGVVDEVFISLRNKEEEREAVQYCLELGIAVHISLTGEDLNYPNAILEKIGDQIVITTSNNMAASWKLALKRLLDIIGGVFGCLVMLALYLYVAPKIRRADPGPVFFTQDRIGKNGRRFKFYKFRSMYLNAEERKAELMEHNEMSGRIFKMKNDPRILPGIGTKIRESSIDEWPQFINVLKGDMSLVGTRPPTVEEYEQYEPHHKARLSFKPGITGLWQVSGRSQITDFEEIVALDDKYIRDWSLGLDLKILFKTVRVVMKKEGAG